MKRLGKLTSFILYMILGAAVVTAMTFLRDNQEVKSGESNTYEPEFRSDGYLSFMANGDTLTTIEIEIVQKPDEIVQGLMYRKKMKMNRGMFFDFPNIQKRFFWMKNTFIPLDIIFVNEENEIVNIVENTEPFSEERIESIYPAKYVVEVNGGFCEKFDVAINNKINILFLER